MVVKRRSRKTRRTRNTKKRLNRSFRRTIKRVRKKKYSRKKKSKKLKRNKKQNLRGGMDSGPAPAPAPDLEPEPQLAPDLEPEPQLAPTPVGGNHNFIKVIKDIISVSHFTNDKIIDYLTSKGVDYTFYHHDKIAPPLLSRLGDIPSEDFDSMGMTFLEIFYSFINLLNGYPDKLPSVYDAIILDSKVHYMELLLENGLCDDSTIIIYNDINTGKELNELRSQKTKQNLELLKRGTGNKYYIKTPFAGSSSCSIAIESSGSSLEDLIGLIPEKNFCIGRNYGLIIQKENPKFENAVAGEIRCCCHEGNIKSISLTWGFKVLGIDISVFMKLLEKNIAPSIIGEIDIKKSCELILDNIVNIEESLNIVPTKSLSEEDFFDEGCTEKKLISEHSSKLSDICNKAYNLLKSGLNLDGSLYRIDLVRSRDSEDYIVNEIENINFGESTATMLQDYEPNIKTLSEDELRVSVPQVEDTIKLKNILETCKPIINSINSLDLRQLLLLFD